jgi:acyl-CoA reductase-like NAD-dependent aldehyde dehydrogenase
MIASAYRVRGVVTDRLLFWCEQVFGPVLSVIPFDNEAEAIRLANDRQVAGRTLGDSTRTQFVLIAGLVLTHWVR